MPKMPPNHFLRRHRPLVSNRIQFALPQNQVEGAASVITPRINFAPLLADLKLHRRNESPSDSDQGPPIPKHRRRPTQPPAQAPNPLVHEPSSENEASVASEDQLDEGKDDEESRSQAADQEFDKVIIPRPTGGAGRPQSGGYNLAEKLEGWTSEFIDEVKTWVKIEASTLLNENQSYASQDTKLIKEICNRATEEFPILAKYEGQWPVIDMLIAHLKYHSSRSRGQAQKRTAEKPQKRIIRTTARRTGP